MWGFLTLPHSSTLPNTHFLGGRGGYCWHCNNILHHNFLLGRSVLTAYNTFQGHSSLGSLLQWDSKYLASTAHLCNWPVDRYSLGDWSDWLWWWAGPCRNHLCSTTQLYIYQKWHLDHQLEKDKVMNHKTPSTILL